MTKIERTKRKSICISIDKEGGVNVKAPYYLSIDKINEFIDSKQKWVTAKVNEIKHKQDSIIEYKELKIIKIFDKDYSLKIGESKISEKSYYLKKINNKNIKEIYREICNNYILNYVKNIQEKYNFKLNNINFITSKRRWGCYDINKNMKLNIMICALPYELINYIIIHEFCHSFEMNHSQKFWNHVNKYIGNYKILKKKLKNYSEFLSLYL